MKSESDVLEAEAHSLLLVDDAVPVRQRLRRMLEANAPVAAVAEAGTVAEAIAQFDALRPSTIVLDLGLPDGSGLEVLRHVKAATRSCMVIVLTNYAEPETRRYCLEQGADFVFAKADQFDHAVEKARLQGRRAPAGAPAKPPWPLHRATLAVSSPYGLHVRPAALLVNVAQSFKAEIEISYAGQSANAKSIMALLVLGAVPGAEVVVTACGEDGAAALAAIRELFATQFHKVWETAPHDTRLGGGFRIAEILPRPPGAGLC